MESPAPYLISWNITKRCNLKCAHCYLDATELSGIDDTSTGQAQKFIEEIKTVCPPGAMLILTGGEPLLRPDIYRIIEYASGKGLTVVLGTNGTLLDNLTVEKLLKAGVKGFGVSLDSVTPEFHNRFRNVNSAWERTVMGINALRRYGAEFHIQLTVTRGNIAEIPPLIEFAYKKGARAVNIFFLVCTGRGQNITDISPSEYETVLNYLTEAERAYKDKIMVRARCAPHFIRVASSLDPDNPFLRGGTSGCIAGKGYLRISPEGYVTPCPYIPVNKKSFNLKDTPLKTILEKDEDFIALRKNELIGKCADCEFNDVCGGCRARSLASTGNLMGDDPWCEAKPSGAVKPKVQKPLWTDDARKRLDNIPVFLRGMVKIGVERYARHKGMKKITPEIMMEMRRRSGR